MPFKPLKPEETESTTALIQAIEKKDRRFRLFQTLFMVGTFVALIFIIGAQQRTLNSVGEQVKNDAEVAERARDQRKEQLDAITRRLDCMVVFFSTPNREDLTISNVENCALNRDEELDKFFQNEPNGNSGNPPNLSDSAPTVTQENAEAQESTPPKEQESVDQTPEQPTVVEPRPPVTIPVPLLPDVPLCVPLTDLCVR